MIHGTSVDENDENDVMIYPNPTNGKLNVEIEGMKQITIINNLGQVVCDNKVDGDNTIINVSQYNDGVYLVRITTENGIITKRISIAR